MNKGTIAGGIALATVIGITYFQGAPNDFIPAPLDFNGTVIEMTHTDDNEGEDLIIYTDKATYSSWDTAEVIFSVTNLSSEGQNVTKRFLFGKTEQTESIEEYIPKVPFIVTVNDYAEKETCEMVTNSFTKEKNEFCSKKKIGSHEETHYKDMWVNTSTVKGQRPKDTANQERIGKVLDAKYKTDSESTTFIESGETKYYRAIVKFTPKSEQTEFYIEATGDQGAFGNLDPFYSASWLYRIPITIDDAKVASTQTGFPVQVDITNASLAAGAQADGDDILFTSVDGTTKLDHEIEIYTTATGRLTAWVEVPSLTGTGGGDTVIYMYYGNSGASNQQNATGVWDVSYQGVYHANDNAANTTVNDSTANNYDGTNAANTSGKTVTGKIGTALTFNGSTDVTTLPNIPAINGVASTTISLWYNPTSLADYDNLIFKTNGDATQRFGMQYGGSGNVDSSAVLFLVGSGSASTFNRSPSGVLANGTWVHLHMVFDGTQSGNQNRAKIYKNGVLQTTTNNDTIPALTTTDSANTIRWSPSADGLFDEVRVSNSARTADWISTEYNNQSATSTFYTIGSQESDTPAAATPSQNIIFFE